MRVATAPPEVTLSKSVLDLSGQRGQLTLMVLSDSSLVTEEARTPGGGRVSSGEGHEHPRGCPQERDASTYTGAPSKGT